MRTGRGTEPLLQRTGRAERLRGKHQVQQQRLGLVDTQSPDGSQHLDGHVRRLSSSTNRARSSGAGESRCRNRSAALHRRGPGDGGPGPAGSRRGPVHQAASGGAACRTAADVTAVAEEHVAPQSHVQAIPLRVGLDPRQARFEERDRSVHDRQAEPSLTRMKADTEQWPDAELGRPTCSSATGRRPPPSWDAPPPSRRGHDEPPRVAFRPFRSVSALILVKLGSACRSRTDRSRFLERD